MSSIPGTVTSKAEQKARRMIRKFAAQAPTLATAAMHRSMKKSLQSCSDNVIVVPLEKKAHLI
jgi:threonylcarbamoyladenosine tRNA methylthiotransferase MtaB